MVGIILTDGIAPVFQLTVQAAVAVSKVLLVKDVFMGSGLGGISTVMSAVREIPPVLKGLLQKHPEDIRQGKPRVGQQSESPRKKEGDAQT
jgi:hypothetical protein